MWRMTQKYIAIIKTSDAKMRWQRNSYDTYFEDKSGSCHPMVKQNHLDTKMNDKWQTNDTKMQTPDVNSLTTCYSFLRNPDLYCLLFCWLLENGHFENYIFSNAQVCSWISYWRWVSIGGGNGLLPDGIKPLHLPMLTKIHDDNWRCQAKKKHFPSVTQ